MRYGRLLASSAFSLLVVFGCSQSSPTSASREGGDHVGSAAEEIQGGVDDSTHTFAVGICAGANPGDCNFICSGTLITPNLVVTARHCVDDAPHEVDCSVNPEFGARQGAMFVTTTQKIFPLGSSVHHTLDVTKIVTPTDRHICGNDVALLILDDVIDPSEAKPVIPGVQYPMGDPTLYGDHRYTAIGYGNTGPEPSGTGAGSRRERQSIQVLCIPGDDEIPCPAGIAENEFYAGDGTCSGDSGSGAYDNKLFNAGTVVSFGVLSRGGDNAGDGGVPPATLCKNGLYTRLDKFRDLVLQAAVTASVNWTLYPKPVPDWTVFVPPKPEAGAPEAGPPAKPKTHADGTSCSKNEECTSGLCVDTGFGLACTDKCDVAAMPSTCPDGFYCKDAACVQGSAPVPPAPPAAAPTTTTTSGCSVGSSSGAPTPAPLGGAGLGILGMLALGIRRSRRLSKRDF